MSEDKLERGNLDLWCERAVLGFVLAILIYSPLAMGAVRAQDFLVVGWLSVGLVLAWGARFVVNPKHRLLWPPICWAVLAFVVYSVGRYATADIEYVARQELIRIVLYAILFFAVVNNLHTQETGQVVAFTLVFLAMAIALYAVIQFLQESERIWHFFEWSPRLEGYRNRGSGTFFCPNNAAGFFEMILPLGLLYTLMGRFEPLTKIFLGYASLMIFAGIAVSVSRGAWVATGVSLLVLFGWLATQREFRLQALLVLAGLTVISIFFFFMANLSQNHSERLGWARTTEDIRFRMWSPAVKIWQTNPIWGVGPAHFDYRFRQFRPPDRTLQARPDRVHNDYLNTLVDFGIVGAALVTAVWALFFWGVLTGWKHLQRAPNDLGQKRSSRSSLVLGASFGLVAILVHSFWDFNMHIPANAIVMVVLLGLVAGRFRFVSEKYWHTVRWPLRVLIGLVLLVTLAFMTWQSVKKTREMRTLQAAARIKEATPEYVKALKDAFAADPKNGDTAYAIGEGLRQQSWQGRDGYQALSTEALEWFKKSISLNPYDPFPIIGAGMCLDWIGRHEEATGYFDQAHQLDPNGHFTLAHIGWHHVQRKDFVSAKKWLEAAFELSSQTNQVASNYLAIALQKLREGTSNSFEKP